MELRTESKSPRWVFQLFLFLIFCGLGIGQSISLALTSGSGSPGTPVVLNLAMSDPNNTQPASLQWVMNYSTTDFSAVSMVVGSAATAAGKTLSCNNIAGTSTCVVDGMNQTAISGGVVATVTLTISATTQHTSSNVLLTTGVASSAVGSTISSTNSGATV